MSKVRTHLGGFPAEPMGSLRRTIAYQVTNGHARLTPRQRRRLSHKANRALRVRAK